MQKNVYLDYNATTPCNKDIWLQMQGIACNSYNSSSIHSFGRKAESIVENSRRILLQKTNAVNKRAIFNSCGTEANNLVVKGFNHDRKIFVSSIEHASIYKLDNITLIKVDKHGIIDLDDLEEKLSNYDGKSLVSVMLANNETGVIQPIKKVVEICNKFDCIVHTDASQAFGKIKVDYADLGVDLMTLSSHKIYAPQGIGVLICNKKLQPNPLISGGGQEYSFRSGTLNVPAIYGFGLACEKIDDLIEKQKDIEILRDFLEDTIITKFNDCKIISKGACRLKNTSYIAMNGVDVNTQLIHFDMSGFSVSSGSACSSGKVGKSHVLESMGLPKDIVNSSVRVSLGLETTKEEIINFIDCWGSLYKRINSNKIKKVS